MKNNRHLLICIHYKNQELVLMNKRGVYEFINGRRVKVKCVVVVHWESRKQCTD